ncbi:hypothetical protein D3C86_1605570 [compost metagenome]
MAEEAHPVEVLAVQAVIVAPAVQRRLGHVQVHHLFGAAGQRRHREAAGVGEQVEHPLALRLLLYPAATVAHVEEQAVVLLPADIQLEAQAVLADQPFVDGLAAQELGAALRQVAVLQQQGVRLAGLPGRRLGQGQQHLLQGGQFGLARLAEQRHQQHALQPVRGDMLEPRPAPSAAMKQATGFVGQGTQGADQLLVQGGDGLWMHGSVSGRCCGIF